MKRLAITTVSILAATLVLSGLQTAPPPQQENTETIRGTVSRADTKTPLPGVRLELIREDFAPLPTGHEKPCKPERDVARETKRTFASTDANGKFAFEGIVPGRYFLFAEHEGFLKFAYGQHDHFAVPTVLEIGVEESGEEAFATTNIPEPQRGGGGQTGTRQNSQTAQPTSQSAGRTTPPPVTAAKIKNRFQNLEFAMTPAPAITGAVISDKSIPLAAAEVQLYQFRYTPLNGRTLKSVRAAVTDDEGKYRLFWLNPGRYVVAGGYSDYGLQPWTQGLKFTPNLPAPDSGYPMNFFPVADTAASAVYVPLNAGEQPVVDIRMRARPRFTVRVQLTGENIPANTALLFVPAGGDACAAPDYGIGPVRNGTLEVHDVPEGLYVAAAVSGRNFLSDVYTLSVENGKRNEMTIPIVPPTTVWGNVFYPESILRNIDLNNIRVNLTRKGKDFRQVFGALVDPVTGAFSIEGVGPGTYYPVLDLPPGFLVDIVGISKGLVPDPPQNRVCRHFVLEGYRYMDAHGHLDAARPVVVPGIVPGAADCLSIDVQYGGAIFGIVQDRSSKPVPGAFVVALPRGIWVKSGDDGVTPADRILTGTTDLDGHFALHGTTMFVANEKLTTTEQEYELFAFESIDTNDIYDPGFPDRFSGREPVRIREEVLQLDGSTAAGGRFSKVVKFRDCDREDALVRKQCIVTVIPAADTAVIR